MIEFLIILFGEYLAYILGAGILVFWWKSRKTHPRFFWQAIAAAILSRGIVTELIRLFWERPRPFIENNITPFIEHVASSSFPSGHAAVFFALGTVVYFYNKKAGVLFLLGAAILSSARVFAFLHWPSDILAGASIGIISAILVIQFSLKIAKAPRVGLPT
ncbi:phosphatase PAP2 family protein, partial [Patescibacteria group bacterium]|nr:phosphatase PAP2 family protein [Patescibacteria group bacterium]